MRHRYAAATAVAVCALALIGAGCTRQQPTETGAGTAAAPRGKAPAPKRLQFALVPKLLNNPVFEIAHDGADAAARELGDIEVVFRAPEQSDTGKQRAIMEGLVTEKVDGIAISCSDPAALKPAIDKAMDAGIPTICFDSDSPTSKRITYYGIDSPKAGRKVAELLVKALGDKRRGKVAIVTGTRGALNLEERIGGARDYLKQFPEIELLPDPIACNDDTDTGVARVREAIRSHPDLVGIAMVGGWPLFADCPGGLAGVEPPGRIKVIGFDALPQEWEYVRRGYVHALVAQRCFGWGKESMQILHDIVVNKRQQPSFIDGGLDVVTRDNVDEYARKWETRTF